MKREGRSFYYILSGKKEFIDQLKDRGIDTDKFSLMIIGKYSKIGKQIYKKSIKRKK